MACPSGQMANGSDIDRGIKLDADGNEVELSGSSVRQDIVLDSQGKPIDAWSATLVNQRRGSWQNRRRAGSEPGEQLGRVVRDVAADDPVIASQKLLTL